MVLSTALYLYDFRGLSALKPLKPYKYNLSSKME